MCPQLMCDTSRQSWGVTGFFGSLKIGLCEERRLTDTQILNMKTEDHKNCLVLKTEELTTKPTKPENLGFAFLTGKIWLLSVINWEDSSWWYLPQSCLNNLTPKTSGMMFHQGGKKMKTGIIGGNLLNELHHWVAIINTYTFSSCAKLEVSLRINLIASLLHDVFLQPELNIICIVW